MHLGKWVELCIVDTKQTKELAQKAKEEKK